MKIFLKSIFFLLAGNIVPLQAQTADTLRIVPDSVIPIENHKSFFKSKKAIGIALPIVLTTYGIMSIESDCLKKLDYSTRDELIEDLWNSRLDDYLQYAPAALAFGLKLGGAESKHTLPDMLLLYTMSNALEAGVVLTAKSLTGRKRPDGSGYHSFPSGHTVTAFVAAEFLHQEYGDKSLWISAAGYGTATLVGLARIYNNRHYVSDVVAGAGVGILSTKIIYWLYPSIKQSFSKKDGSAQALIFPSYENGRLSIVFSCVF